MPFLFVDDLLGNRKSVRIPDKKIAVHVVAGGYAGSRIPAGFEGVAGILRDAAGVDDSHRIQHRAAVFVEKDILADGITNDLESYALRLEGCGVRAIVLAFDRGVVHEVQFDVADAPVPG